MVITGAGGHAIEVLSVLEENSFPGDIYFFDDVNKIPGNKMFGRFAILDSTEVLQSIFSKDPNFILGVGDPAVRKILRDKMINAGGILQSVISPFAHIGKNEVQLGAGLNVMTGAVITGRVIIGEGTLVNTHCSIHHDVVVGEYCQLSPGCRILGNVKIGNFVSVGAGAVLLPGVEIGNYAVVGAGAVVTKNVPSNQTVTGIPAKPLFS